MIEVCAITRSCRLILWPAVVVLLFLTACRSVAPAAEVTQELTLPVATVVAATVTPAPAMSTQVSRSTTMSTPIQYRQPLTSIELAEREARIYPSASPPRTLAPPADKVLAKFARASGVADRTCVEANLKYEVRSGEFVAGSWADYRQGWRTNANFSKLWWIPLHADRMPGLLVRATLLDVPTTTAVYELYSTGYGNGIMAYVSGVRLPQAGRCMLVATSGSDWGCFLLTLTGVPPTPQRYEP